MSEHKIFTVTVLDSGCYTIRVAAGYADEAKRIAERVICEEFTPGCPDVTVDKREIISEACEDGIATLAATQYRATATYSMDFEMTVPATSPSEAQRHAKRLYEENCGPFEFDICGDAVSAFNVREVQI